MFYKVLGNLDHKIIDQLESMIMKLHNPNTLGFQRIEFNNNLIDFLKDIFFNVPLTVQHNGTRLVQKAFYSDPGTTYPIHKDGLCCLSALNIAVSSNSDDWVRWYDDDLINQLSNVENIRGKYGVTRNTNIENSKKVPFIEEYIPKKGDVYILNVDQFHTWHCGGPNPRIIIQTKFDGYPSFEELKSSIVFDNIKFLTT